MHLPYYASTFSLSLLSLSTIRLPSCLSAGVQALEQLQAAVAAASYGDGGATAVGGSGRSVGWVASNGGAEDDAPLSLRALSRAAAAGGLARQGRIPLSGRTGAEVQR